MADSLTELKSSFSEENFEPLMIISELRATQKEDLSMWSQVHSEENLRNIKYLFDGYYTILHIFT